MRRVSSYALFLFLFFFIAALSFAFSNQDMIDLKNAGFSDEIILLMTRSTGSLQPKDIIELRKGGLSEKVIKQMILDDQEKQPVAGDVSDRLVVEEIIKLKSAGVSDETIQKMLEREERERVRYYGIARTIKHPDGSESIVYGNLQDAPFPDTKHHYIGTSQYLESLSLSINGDDTLSPEEQELWKRIFQGLRLKKDIE
jgi:hypothetical protein